MAELAGPDRRVETTDRYAGHLDARAVGEAVRALTPVRAAEVVGLPVPDAADERAPCGDREVQDDAVRVCAGPDEDALSPAQAGGDVPAVTGSP
jgi:hypothetical protein